MNDLPVVLAVDAIQLIIFVVVILVMVINGLINAAKGGEQRPKVQPRPQQQPRRPQGRPGEPLRDEVDDFLRRAMARQKGQQPSKRSQRRASPPAPPEVVPATIAPGSPASSLMPTLEDHIDTAEFSQRAAQLTHLAEDEERFAASVGKSFEHRLGQLAPGMTSEEPRPAVEASPAANIVAMLRDPQSVRAAILLAEIMRPRSSELGGASH